MEGKVFLGHYLIWVMVLLGQLHGYKSCIQRERNALLDLKQYLINVSEEGQSDYVLPTWKNDTKSHCCRREGVKCSRTSRRVTKIAFGDLYLKENSFFNLSLLHPFEEVQSLDLSECAFSVLFDDKEVFCGMKNLQELYLRGNYLAGQLPLCLGILNKLQVLDLSLNQLSGTLPSSFNGLDSLEYLSLSDNNFTDLFSLSSLANLRNLKVLKLSSTSDKVQVVTESTWLPKFQLSIASLPSCGLKKIPNFLMYQKKLLLLDLSSNRIPGTIPSWLLANNPELEVLQLQSNSFAVFQIPTIVHKLQFLDFSANNINGVVLPDGFGHVLSNLIHMNGSHNSFQGKFPSSIGEMKNISFLDLSHNNLSGEIPRSLFTGCYSLQILHLSHNKFTGHVLPRQTNLTSLVVLRMDNNLFTGEIGEGFLTLVNLSVLDISNNLLSGSVPSLIPNSSDMFMLLLSNNLLEGTLPSSLLANQHLNFLDLSGNLLSGALPSYDSSMYGIKLFLHNNSFTGEIPRTLLENAEILDLRNNKLSGSIPQFVNTMDMRIFLLKGNNLTGSIPRELCGLKNIGVLDLSNNKLSGDIPSCLHNLSFGSGEYEQVRNGASEAYGFVPSLHWELYRSTFLVDEFKIEYETYMSFEIQFAAKQRYDSYTEESEFSRGTLDFMYGLDLSSNELSGVIPSELGELSKLRAMNLSRNFLSGSIPDSFSKLKDIESLDLSYNMLHGNIPRQLTNLTSLAVFNVSYNNLSGIIPQGRHFDTLNDMSYLSNPLLCGLPTKRSCQEAKKRTEEVDKRGEEVVDKRGEEEDDEADIDMMVFYWTSASTYVTALIGILVLMCFDCLWRGAWLRLGKVFLGKYLIWMILILGQLHGYKSCVEKERKALLELKQYLISREEEFDYVLPTWTYDTESDCCIWERVKCNRTSKRVTEISFGELYLKENSLLNLSLLHPFEDVRSLNLSWNGFNGLFDDVEGYKSLGRLRNLEILDLTFNRFNNSIFPFLNSATSLKTLSLGNNNLDGPFPAEELKDLTNLELLDLSVNRFQGPLEVQDLSALRMLKSLDLSWNRFYGEIGLQGYNSLRNLEILYLHGNGLNNSVFPFLNSVTSLKTLFLRYNNLDGPFPAEELKDLTNLELLDLSRNKFNGSIPIRVLPTLRNLKALDLSGICDMKNMQELDLSRNKLVGQFPLCLTGLTELQVLDLSSNQLTGKVPSTLGSLKSLKYLSLLDNNFEGFFSLGSLANLSELRFFQLNSKSKSLQVESEGSWIPKFQLVVIVLQSCNLVKVPHFLLHQKELVRVALSDNKISGDFPHWLLANNTKLEVLFLQNNSFTSFQLQESAHSLLFLDVSANDFNHLLPENIGWVLPHVKHMKLGENSFQGCLPSSLGNMKRISYLDLSHNNFHGTLPRSFVMGCYSMSILKLSYNKLSGEVFPESANLTLMSELYMDNNLFTGKIGQGLRNLEGLELLDLSNNNLTGVIPSWIGNFRYLNTLLLSNNSLEGEIPISLFNLTNLELLDLSANILSGGIPPHIISRRDVILLLQDNKLSGVIPDTLVTDNVSVLDLRNNGLSGNIPAFTNTQGTSTILLRGNNLTGSIPHQLCGLRNIQLLDLAKNRLNGSIPPCFSNTSFAFGKVNTLYDYGTVTSGVTSFTGVSEEYRVESEFVYFKPSIVLNPFIVDYMPITHIKIEFATKHRYDAYLGGNLKLLYGMDLSDNELSGDIPADLGALLELQALNLSHNKLSGVIPESFSGLKNVESLDLSFNKLQGRIPSQLTELSSLEVFNVSFNNLSGVIPQGKQFNTFDGQSFLGNPLLCGQSINTSCDRSHYQEPDNGVNDDESKIDMISFYWSLAAAYVTVLVGIFSSLSFDSPWSRFWFYLVDAFIHKAKSLLCCVEKERMALLELKRYLLSITEEKWFDYVLFTWTNDTKSDCCRWDGVKCNRTSQRVAEIAFGTPYFNKNSLLNLSLLHPFEDVRSLDLGGSFFIGLFDDVEGYKSLGRLRNLEILDLSFNRFNNSIFPFLNAATSLTTLYLRNNNNLNIPFPAKENNFEGVFSVGWLANLSHLRVFKLGSKSKSFQVESEGSWKPKFQLGVIELSSCNLVKVPNFLIYQKDLSRLDLSDNKMSGDFPHWLLTNNTKLEVLFLQNNLLSSFHLPKSAHNLLILDVSANDFSHLLPENIGWIFPHLRYMKLADNRFQGHLPSSLGNMKRLGYLDISHNRFHGELPRSFVMGCHSIFVLTLSHNQFSGEVLPESANFTGIWELSMDNNLFTGKIGQGLRNLGGLQLLDISNNNLTGVIPSWIGELQNLNALLLSNNSLEGEIPISLFDVFFLQLVDLSANTLSGDIPPQVNSLGKALLLFQDNNLSGVIPDTLLTHVAVLDLRNNRLSGNIPAFTNTKYTHTLLLRGNSLTGSIPSQLCGIKDIKLLDLANNRLNGSIPSCFSNTSFAFGKEDTLYDQHYGGVSGGVIQFYQQTNLFKSLIEIRPFTMNYVPDTQIKIEFTTKHRYDTYLGGNLKLLYGLDLSGNELSGDIPTDLGGLLELQALNLSHNKLSGLIPNRLSGLKNVESLDLSFNRLQGRIPSQLTELSSLAVFNVSFNNLSGVIPQGKQFNTFDAKSYLGNPLLCGKPTNTSCSSNRFQETDNEVMDDESQIDMVSFYWSLAAAYVTILLGIFASLSFDSPWRRFWFYLVDAFIHKAKNLL
ncbi:unnamed protein product [Eruca vesicaria subsp. sativa]|uniref:Leucine-rich repeat-containing N-terminal plant-type domain-containing protein n=1 Tax=Eruca vesicaria subsp. sativa TaxID=29727 RepID=A0ABC8KTC3_ERUVS|nr:unnamed protein product [Eruca vesicaria subsp. sativa]